MTILGIDPGTATTGFGVIKKKQIKNKSLNEFEIVQFGVISTPKTDTPEARLKTLFEDLSSIIKKHKPQHIGIEKLFFATNQKTAIAVAQARGVIVLAAALHNIPIIEFTPLQVKNILCGYGKAEKRQVQAMVQQTFKLKQLPKPDDAADALAIALCTGWGNALKTAIDKT